MQNSDKTDSSNDGTIEVDLDKLQNYTTSMQIETCAGLIARWKAESKRDNLILKNVDQYQMITKYVNKVGKEFKEKVMKRVDELLDFDRATKIQDIRKRLDISYKIAQKLYEDAKEHIAPEDLEAFHPKNWLADQEQMRKVWLDFKKDNNQQNSFFKYMQFMYNNYPANFGKEISDRVEKNEFIDGAEIYYMLTNN